MTQKNHPEFDRFAEEYDALQKENLGVFGKDISVFSRYKVELVKSLMLNEPIVILEFGCGIGRNMPYFKKFFPAAKLFGCDTSKKSLELASEHHPFARYDTIEEPSDLGVLYPQGVDLIFIAGVLHHIPDETEQAVWLKALCSILHPKGQLVVFEHNPYNPLTRHMFNTCPYDATAKLVKPAYCRKLLKDAGFNQIQQLYTLFFIWRNSFWNKLERMLYWLPLGGQYCISARKDKG